MLSWYGFPTITLLRQFDGLKSFDLDDEFGPSKRLLFNLLCCVVVMGKVPKTVKHKYEIILSLTFTYDNIERSTNAA